MSSRSRSKSKSRSRSREETVDIPEMNMTTLFAIVAIVVSCYAIYQCYQRRQKAIMMKKAQQQMKQKMQREFFIAKSGKKAAPAIPPRKPAEFYAPPRVNLGGEAEYYDGDPGFKPPFGRG